jgi:hypothetical protein
MTKKKKVESAPYCFKSDWELADANALQALEKGEADEHQQKRALSWIIENAAATYQIAWEPDNERASSFESGRRFVGLKIVGLLKLNLGKLRRIDNE